MGFGCPVSEESKEFGLGMVNEKSTRFVYIGFSTPNALSPAIRVPFYLQMQGAHLLQRRFIFCFREDGKEAQSVSLALAVSSITSIQSNQYALVTY